MVKLHHYPSSLVLLFLLSSSQMPCCCSSSQTKLRETRHFQRLDPLNRFKIYNGGYDIRSKHYWGRYFRCTWIRNGGVLDARRRSTSCDFASLEEEFRRFFGFECRDPSKLLASLATHCHSPFHLARLVMASGVALVAAHKFHRKAKKPEKALLDAAGASCHAIRRVLRTVEEVRTLLRSYDAGFCALLGEAALKLRAELAAIRKTMREDGALVDAVLGLT
uniref:Uncharacterized protein n=1 Tax=Ananas comosus var. bracteatus TaxID=296719 RepID=A0A6V7Q459_ANACO|nr:unnamed protein product [Ananas comosus var. bracteatus]